MRTTPWRGTLFGGAIFAAGLAHADTSFEYVVGPDVAYARSGNIEINGVNYSDTDTGPGGFFGVSGYQFCPNYDPYSYASYFSNGFVSATNDCMTATADSSFCGDVRSDIRAYFMISTPTELRIAWNSGYAYEGITAGVWRVEPSGTATLVAGPGAGAVSSFQFEDFTLGAGLYYFEASAVSESFGFAGADLTLFGDACACDFDGSGTLNFDDIDGFVGAFLAGSLDADLDGSGTLNFDDIDAFITCFLGGCG